MPLIKCANCGKEVFKKPYLLKERKHLFCGKKCADTFRRFRPGRIKKRCGSCREILLLSEFPKKKNSADGLYCYCKKCVSQITKKYRDRNQSVLQERRKEKYLHNKLLFKRRNLYSKYRTTPEYIDNLYHQQGGLCVICKTNPIKHVDHDHERGLVRGLLCGQCNVGLGMFRDNALILSSAIQYLEKNGGI